MAYITMEDYAEYFGEEIPNEEFDRYAARASEAVDAVCGWKIAAKGFDNFDEFCQRQIKLAVCAQCEAFWLNGIESALGDTGGAEGYAIGKSSVTARASSTVTSASAGGTTLCAKAVTALFPTGLLYAGVSVV